MFNLQPFDIDLVKIEKQTNDMRICQRKEDIKKSDIPLVSFTTNRLKTISKLYVGDIYFCRQDNRFMLFTLHKIYRNAIGINACNFLFLRPKKDGSYVIDETVSMSDFYQSPYSKRDLSYVGNVFVHKNIRNLFKGYVEQEDNQDPLRHFMRVEVNTRKTGIIYRDNIDIMIHYYQTAYDDVQSFHSLADMNNHQVWEMKARPWGILLQADIHYCKVMDAGIDRQQFLHRTDSLTCKNGSLLELRMSQDLLKQVAVRGLEGKDEETKEKRKEIKHFVDVNAQFFVFFNTEIGEVEYLSKMGNCKETMKSMRFFFSPKDNEVFSVIEPSNDNLYYGECLLPFI